MTIGENIKHFRKEKGFTQEELGKMIGLSGVAIMRYEKGQREPKQNILTNIAKALGVHLRDLVDTSIWNEFDKSIDTERLAKDIEEIVGTGAIKSYLEELGYIVKIPLTAVDGEMRQWDISGNGISVKLSEEEFERLKTSSADLINSFLWKKSQEKK